VYVPTMHYTTPEERRKLGQTRRKQVARGEHGALNSKSRNVRAITLMEGSMKGRVRALVKLKYELMAQSSLSYFCGTRDRLMSLVNVVGVEVGYWGEFAE
jgi:hypothetical protein